MNRRVVLLDQEETPKCAAYYGSGLGDEIYTVQALEAMEPEDRDRIMSLGEGDAIMLVGSSPFQYIKGFYHLGVRNETYYDCSKLRRLSIEGGAFAKVVVDFPDKSIIEDFMSENFTTPVTFPEFEQSVIHTYQDALSYLEFLSSLPEDEYFGFDYEGSGMPMDRWYELSGLSLATLRESRFISLTDVRHQVGADSQEYHYLLAVLGKFLVQRMNHLTVYNMAYEWQASHRILGVDLYDLLDVSVVNVMDGNHEKKYSLKWTGQAVLQVNAWDTEFDRISDLIDSMLFEETGKLKKDKHKVLKVTPSTFEQTPEWAELCRRYPGYIDEFRSLIREYWGNAFMCIPSEILGYYCNLDAFYTLLIFKVKENEYSKDCWEVNLNNARLGCRLMTGGLYIDEPFRAKYEKYCHQMMAWGITYCASARCWIKMEKHKKLANDLSKYNPVAQKLMRQNQFYQGNALEIVKNLMAQNLDNNDCTATGLNEGALVLKYGSTFAEAFLDIVKDAMVEVKMKSKIDSGIVRKKKILGIIAEKSIPLLGLDKIKLGTKHIELEKYLYYENAYNELQKVKRNQLNDIFNIPDEIKAFRMKMSLLEYSNYVSDNYFKCKSPLENDEIAYELTELFKYQSCYLGAMLESTQQLPETTKFYSSRGITDINVGFQEFMAEWEPNYKEDRDSALYPQKTFNLAVQFFGSPRKTKDQKKSKDGKVEYIYSLDDKLKEVWTDFNGYKAQSQYFPDINNDFVLYSEAFDPGELTNDAFFFMRKMTLNYLLYKKYAKLCSTYVGSDGMFKKNNKFVIEDENHLPIREADPDEPGAVEKCFVKYQVNEKSSKRWSSGFHTIVSHSDCKDILLPPPSWDENGNIIYGGSDQMLTYFDINKN